MIGSGFTQHTVVANDLVALGVTVSVVLPLTFGDGNYTAVISVRTPAGSEPLYFVNGFTIENNVVCASITCQGVLGDVVEVGALAVHR